MSSAENPSAPETEVLLKQYEQAWQVIEHFDSSYIQISLLYIALIGAYIGGFDKIKGNSILISCCLALISICIIGAIWRLRKLIDQQFDIVAAIEEVTGMNRRSQIGGLDGIRTSTYLGAIVFIMSVLAIVLTMTKQP